VGGESIVNTVRADLNMVNGEWCNIHSQHPESFTAELTVCAKPYHGISVNDEGDDMLGVRLNIGFDQLDDLAAAIATFKMLPQVEAELTYIQEGER
jgi:hypothetical protein